MKIRFTASTRTAKDNQECTSALSIIDLKKSVDENR